MRIILSPAKQMRERPELPHAQLPPFMDRTEELLAAMKALSPLQLASLWNCSDALAMENLSRLYDMNLYEGLTPALFAYDGIAFKYLSPETLSSSALAYLNGRLRILSGFYGILRPDDGVASYRLEMQARLKTENAKNLYDFWGERLHGALKDGSGLYINLASKEYSKCIEKHLEKGEEMIDCVFAQLQGSKLVQKGVYAKMARGAMVRFMAENAVDTPEGMKDFDTFGFRFDEGRSSANSYVFTAGEIDAEK